MPFKSGAQRRLFFAAARGEANEPGAPSPTVAREFIRDAGDEPPETPGLKYRREQFRFLKQAADDGSVQGKMRVDSARRAVQRQEAVSRTRMVLNRIRGK
jgi:hypothetical protein